MAIVLLTVVLPLSFLVSCNRDKNDVVEVDFDPQTSYTLKETNVEALISESGITRYKMISPTFMMFGKSTEPYWYYPDGVYIERYDSTFCVELIIKADTAYRYERRKLIEAKGDVDITNMEGVRCQTSQVFIDEQKEIAYSDSFTVFSREGVLENIGMGFSSNLDFTEYTIYNAGLEYYFESQRRAIVADSIPPDEN